MADLWHAAFVYGSSEIDPESGYPKYPALRTEAAVYAKNADHAREIIGKLYRNLIHYECLYKMAVGTFIITQTEHKCPN